jgi:hypothetical protein
MMSDKVFVVMVASVDNLQDYGQFISDESIGLNTNPECLAWTVVLPWAMRLKRVLLERWLCLR